MTKFQQNDGETSFLYFIDQNAMIAYIEKSLEMFYSKYPRAMSLNDFRSNLATHASNLDLEQFNWEYGEMAIKANIKLNAPKNRMAALELWHVHIDMIGLNLAMAHINRGNELAWPFIANANHTCGRLSQILEYEKMLFNNQSRSVSGKQALRTEISTSGKIRRQQMILKVLAENAPHEKWADLPTAISEVLEQLKQEFKSQPHLVEGKDLTAQWFTRNIHKWTHADEQFLREISKHVKSIGAKSKIKLTNEIRELLNHAL